MFNFVLSLDYKIGGKKFHCDSSGGQYLGVELDSSDNRLSLRLVPERKIELLSLTLTANRSFSDGELFFANGYQSWSTTKEYKKTDIQHGTGAYLKPIRSKYELVAGIGDDLFAKYGGRGFFHSFTYTYIRNGESFSLLGSLSERNGYTIFYADMPNSKFIIEKDVQGMIISDACTMLDLVAFNGSYDEVFDKYFALMNLPEPRCGRLAGYTSWYNYFQNINEKIILRDLEGLGRAQGSANIFQIDDGFEPFVGDWLVPDPAKFPHGMKYVVDKIHDRGLMAGLWLAPFSAQKKAYITSEHPEWLIKKPNGKPELAVFSWGGAYTLDIYNEEVRAHIKHVFDVVLNEWGFDMVKLDFLYSQCISPRAGKSRGTIMCEALDFLRECVGDKLFLGCGVPLGPSFGVVDACRISADVALKYDGEFFNKINLSNELPCAQNAINNTIFRRHLNGRVFRNDPDVFFLRKTNLTFTDEQKYLLARLNSIFGDVLFVSDNVGDYSEDDVTALKGYFAEQKTKIIGVRQPDTDIFEIRYNDNGEKMLRFNLATGKIL